MSATVNHLSSVDIVYYIWSARNMSGELAEQVRIIEKMVNLDFTKYVTEDLNRPLDDARPLLEEVCTASPHFSQQRCFIEKYDLITGQWLRCSAFPHRRQWGKVRVRPKLGWMGGVKVALGNRGMTVEAARQCAKDRKEWRALVHM